MSEGIDLKKLPDWVKSSGLPAEAAAAIDRWWQPAWERIAAPLHSTGYAHGSGTVYTAAYFPAERRAEYRWPGFTWRQSLEDFGDGTHTETFVDGRRAA